MLQSYVQLINSSSSSISSRVSSIVMALGLSETTFSHCLSLPLEPEPVALCENSVWQHMILMHEKCRAQTDRQTGRWWIHPEAGRPGVLLLALLLDRIRVWFPPKLWIQLTRDLRFGAMRIDRGDGKHDVFHLATVCNRRQFDDRVERHFQVW